MGPHMNADSLLKIRPPNVRLAFFNTKLKAFKVCQGCIITLKCEHLIKGKLKGVLGLLTT